MKDFNERQLNASLIFLRFIEPDRSSLKVTSLTFSMILNCPWNLRCSFPFPLSSHMKRFLADSRTLSLIDD